MQGPDPAQESISTGNKNGFAHADLDYLTPFDFEILETDAD